jgi:hypothetical protein
MTFSDTIFLQKRDGVLYFAIMKIREFTERYNQSRKEVDIDLINPAVFEIYAFDGWQVTRCEDKSHNLNLKTYVNGYQSRSWMFENPFRNTHGYATGWRNRVDMDEILPLNSRDRPVYLPKDRELNSHEKTSIFSLTADWKICKFSLWFEEN